MKVNINKIIKTIKTMRKITVFIALMLMFAFGANVLAQGAELPNPGLTPDSPFYFLKSWKESIQTFFTFGAENKAKQFLHLSEVRLAEYQKMIEKGILRQAQDKKLEIAQNTLEKYEKQLNQALEKVQEAKEKGRDIEKLATLITEKTLKHQGVLVGVLEKIPEEAKEAIEKAIEVSRKGSETAVEAVSKEKKEELQQKIEEVKVKVETMDWKVYKNKEYGFEVRYPPGWVVSTGALPNNFVFGESGWPNTAKVNITVYTESFIDKIYKEEAKERICTRVVLLFEEAYRCEGTDFIYLEIEHNGKFYLWSVFGTRESEKFKIFDQILSTFKFIELEEAEEETPKEEICNIPKAPVLTDPGISVKKHEAFTLNWTSIEGAKRYWLQRDTSTNFSIPAWYCETNSDTDNPGIGTSAPEVTTTYYYRVKACSDTECSSYSNVVDMEVIVPSTAPEEKITSPTCSVPEDPVVSAEPTGPVASGAEYSINWSIVAGASHYIVQRDTDLAFSNPSVIYSGSLLHTKKESHSPSVSTVYWYKARAENSCGVGPWSNIKGIQVKVPAVPGAPVLTDPGNSVNSGESFTLNWTSIEGAIKYQVQRDTNSNFSYPYPIPPDSGQNSRTDSPNPKITTTYYYRVKACNDRECGPWSNVVDMRAIVVPLIRVTSPKGGEVWVEGETHRITWNSAGIDEVAISIKGPEPFGNGYITENRMPVSASPGYYDWTIDLGQIPINEGDDYKIIINDFDNPWIKDESDNYFSIVSPEP